METTKIPCCPPRVKYIYPPPVENTTKIPETLPPFKKIKVLPSSILTNPNTVSSTTTSTTTISPTTTSTTTSQTTALKCKEPYCKKLNF